jgi:hypothetical protein
MSKHFNTNFFVKFITGLFLVLTSWSAFANDTFNPVNGQLTIPSVSVGSTVYTNVVITVGQVLSVGTAPAIGPNDTYNSSNGTLKIPIVNVSGQLYYNVVITLGSVINIGPSSSQTFTIAGNVTGLNSGQTLVLSNNANDTFNVVGGSLLNPFANSGSASFSFSSPVPYNGNYAVTITTQPVGQTCTVNNGTGFNVINNVTNITVTCSGAPLTIGGTISGLPTGQSVTLLLNSGSALTLSQTGQNIPFTFFQTITTNGSYTVTVGTQLTNGICTVSNGFGAGVIANITNISVSCITNTPTVTPITIGGTLSGLNSGQQLTLLNNGGNPLQMTSNGSFSFSTQITSGANYSVTVATQPTGQVCTVNNGSGSNATNNINNISVSCSTNTYSISGSVSGLTSGQQLTLLLNGSNPLIQSNAESFVFQNNISAGGSYSITVGTQPLGQTCTVSNGVGSNVQSNISNIAVSCTTNQYTIGGTITGLASGQSVTLLNNGANSLIASNNGNFIFSNSIVSGGSYSVAISSQPSSQICSARNASGSNVQSNTTNISISCISLSTFSISGTVYGLNASQSVTLLLNGSKPLIINGANIFPSGVVFVFPSLIASGGSYTVTIGSQPQGLSCTTSNPSGNNIQSNVYNILVNCY